MAGASSAPSSMTRDQLEREVLELRVQNGRLEETVAMLRSTVMHLRRPQTPMASQAPTGAAPKRKGTPPNERDPSAA